MKAIYIFIAIGGAGVLIFLYVAVTLFYGITRTVNETKMIASYSCDASELRLMHKISDSFDHQGESLYFEFKKDVSTTTTSGVRVTQDGWQLTAPPPYYSLSDIRTFSGFTADYSKARAWNVFVDTDVDHIHLSELSDCMEQHHEDISATLQSFMPSISLFKNTERLTKINSISSIKGKVEFACDKKIPQDKVYRVTMSGSPHAYKPNIEMYDQDVFSSDNEQYPYGFWLITAPAPKNGTPSISDLRSCVNFEGETFGAYFDSFDSFASKIGFSDSQTNHVR